MNRLQRVMALGLVVCVGVPMRTAEPRSNNTAMIVGAVGVTVVAVGAAVCLAGRESNAVKIARAQVMMNASRCQIEQSLELFRDGRDMNLAAKSSGALRAEMVALHSSLDVIYGELLSRYGSWVAPWNWTNDMQNACAQIQRFILQTKLALLLLTAQQAQETIDTYTVRVDQALARLDDSTKFYEVLRSIGSLKKELGSLTSLTRSLEHDLALRAFLKEATFDHVYGVKIERIERGLHDFVQKTDLLLIVLQYVPCFVPDINEDALIKAVRVICGKESSYPVMYAVDKLGNDIERINRMTVYVSCEQVCLDMLDKVRTRLMESGQQAIERQAYENYVQQQRLAAAAEAQALAAKAQAEAVKAQASAQREQAWAQSRQAAALEERNRIERNKKTK